MLPAGGKVKVTIMAGLFAKWDVNVDSAHIGNKKFNLF
jgi:hypothetical protein